MGAKNADKKADNNPSQADKAAKRQNRELQPSLAVGEGASAGEVVVARGVGK